MQTREQDHKQSLNHSPPPAPCPSQPRRPEPEAVVSIEKVLTASARLRNFQRLKRVRSFVAPINPHPSRNLSLPPKSQRLEYLFPTLQSSVPASVQRSPRR